MYALLASSPATFVGLCLLLGLLVGSFLNVVIYRLPIIMERRWRADCAEINGQQAEPQPAFDLVRPRSACPQCHAPIKAWQNIPVLSWLLLRGRCANCSTAISARYPLVELVTGLLSALVAWRFGFGFSAACALLVTWMLLALGFIDFDRQMLYDELTLLLLWLGLVASLFHGYFSAPEVGAALPVDTRSAVIGAVGGYLALWSVYKLFKLITGKEGMGYGDFKLLAALGAWMGWKMLFPIVLISAAAGAALGLLLIALKKHEMGRQMPFGPYLAAAGFLVMLWGPQLVARYLGLFA